MLLLILYWVICLYCVYLYCLLWLLGCELNCGHYLVSRSRYKSVSFHHELRHLQWFLNSLLPKEVPYILLFCRQFGGGEIKTVSLCNLDWPRACSVDQVSLELTVILLFHLHSTGVIGIYHHVWYYAVLGMKAQACCMLGKLSIIWATSPRPKKSLLVLMLIFLLWLSIGCIKCFSINMLRFCFY